VTVPGFRSDWFALIGGFGVVMTLELVLILWTTQGNFTYTLDDPYIHLALAENLAQSGHYGLNLEEYASPSSSIIWPFLLVPFFAVDLGVYGPLLLNVLFALAALLVIHRIVLAAATPNGRAAPQWLWAGTLFIFFAVNGFGVVFTGMEHALHMLVTAATIYFINQMMTDAGTENGARSGYADLLLVLCIVLSPLVRFEGLAISAFAIVMLIALRKPRLALVSALLTALCLAVYFLVMSGLGLPWLPSSVLVKSGSAANVASQGDLLARLYGASLYAVNTAVENFITPEGRFLLVIAALIAAQGFRAWRGGERTSSTYVIGVLAVIALHFAFGRFGWYGRYQCYVFVFAIGAALHVFSGSLIRQHVSSRPQRLLYGLAAILIVATLGFRQSFYPFMTTSIGAENIYEQQRQMHNFVTQHWKAPVAVNDIGYVAFQNDGYVLDLWGLGSEEARRMRMSRDPDMLHKLTANHGVHLAMIYEEPFSSVIPTDWRKLAELHLTTRRITRDFDRVSFFIFGLDQSRCSEVATQLKNFARTLPRPENLVVDAHACDMSNASRSGMAFN
jgi:hypothetical protein